MITATMRLKTIREKAVCKLRSIKGASLGEMMLAVSIMLLASAVVISGIQLGVRQYKRSVILSEEKILASSLSNIVESELANARSVTLNGDKLATFIPKTYGLKQSACSFYSVTVAEDKSMVEASASKGGELVLGMKNLDNTITGHLLLSSAAYSKYKLTASIDVTYSANAFHVLLTIKDPSGLSTNTTFDVLPLNDPGI